MNGWFRQREVLGSLPKGGPSMLHQPSNGSETKSGRMACWRRCSAPELASKLLVISNTIYEAHCEFSREGLKSLYAYPMGKHKDLMQSLVRGPLGRSLPSGVG